MSDERTDLIARLRTAYKTLSLCQGLSFGYGTFGEAASMLERDGARIAELEAENARIISGIYYQEMRVERDEARKALAEAREALARWLIAHGFVTGHGDTLNDLLGELSWQVKERSAEAEALRTALAMMYDKWVDGDDCYEEPDTFSGFLGKAFQLSLTEEDHVISLIGKDCPTRAIDAAIAKEPVQVPAGECPYPIRQDHSIAACVEAGDCGCGEQKP